LKCIFVPFRHNEEVNDAVALSLKARITFYETLKDLFPLLLANITA